MRPTLVVVTGHSGAGKTTLAGKIADVTGWTAVIRDAIKEDLGTKENDPVNERFFAAIHDLLNERRDVVADAAFQHFRWAPVLEPLTEHADLRVVVCGADTEIAKGRITRRIAEQPARRVHADAALLTALEDGTYAFSDYDPPRLDVPTMAVDTTDGYDPSFDEIVAFVR